MPQSLRKRMAIAAGLGGVAALGQAPVGVPWATLAALAGAFVLLGGASGQSRPVRAAAWLGWAFGAGYFAATLFWIVEPFLVDIARHGWMAPFALMLCAAGFALFWGGGFALAAWLARDGAWRRAVAFAAAMTAMELARSYILTGFPWALIGHVWVGWAPMQLASLGGSFLLTFATLLLPALAVAAWPGWQRLAGVAVLGAVLYGGGVFLARQPVPDLADAPVLRLVQPNAAQHLKWDPDHAPGFFRRQLEFTAAGTEGRPDLILWPETAIPVVLNRAEAWLEQISAAAGDVPVVLGIQRLEGNDAYNSLILLDGLGEVATIYDKFHLVPFGEYLPLSDLFDTVGMTLFGSGMGFGYTPGPGARVLDLDGLLDDPLADTALGTALPLICYEAIFPQDVRAGVRADRPGWLLQITNDAWFGEIAGPYQHLAQARLRAVEQGLPMVRVANTGVSAVIDARGRVLQSLPLGEAGWFDAPLPAALPPTLYAQTGDWAVSVTLLFLFGGLALGRRRIGIDAAAAGR